MLKLSKRLAETCKKMSNYIELFIKILKIYNR